MSVAELTQLGGKTAIPSKPADAVLETIEVTSPDLSLAVVRFSCPEFTSLCPKTGQPDFAKLFFDYVPNKKLIESKSLKLFLCSFRNHGAFHEEVSAYIFNRLCNALAPHWLRMTAFWYARGGIPIDVFLQTGQPPRGVFVPSITALHGYSYDGR